MAAPNIAGLTTITGKTDVQNVIDSATAITTNAAASGLVYKVNSLIVSNIDGIDAASITVDFFRSSTAYHIAQGISIPPGAAVNIIDKDSILYLEEGDAIRCTASAIGDLQAICSYEIIG